MKFISTLQLQDQYLEEQLKMAPKHMLLDFVEETIALNSADKKHFFFFSQSSFF